MGCIESHSICTVYGPGPIPIDTAVDLLRKGLIVTFGYLTDGRIAIRIVKWTSNDQILFTVQAGSSAKLVEKLRRYSGYLIVDDNISVLTGKTSLNQRGGWSSIPYVWDEEDTRYTEACMKKSALTSETGMLNHAKRFQ
jgi:hypothetical protein